MIESSASIEELPIALGTPSAQRIIISLVIWETLSLKELQKVAEISESQLHVIIKRLIISGIVKKEKRGIYTLGDESFVNILSKAYLEKIKHLINQKIYEIRSLLKKREIEIAFQTYNDLKENYQPVLSTYFSHILSSIAHSFLEYYEIEK